MLFYKAPIGAHIRVVARRMIVMSGWLGEPVVSEFNGVLITVHPDLVTIKDIVEYYHSEGGRASSAE
jgi:hypothetical protein